ncbi:hypothetical protein TNCV_1265631 [Trichonephila clavipes]|nr:hypothetical protein TNCV_1265631 [Trichonephila clavipes]
MQLLPVSAYSLDMPAFEHVWDLVGRCLVRDPDPTASKDELWVLHFISRYYVFNKAQNPINRCGYGRKAFLASILQCLPERSGASLGIQNL